MNTTGKRRLLTLAKFLETAHLPGGFDMTEVCMDAKDGVPECGTSACAIGWATTIPSFRRAGLILDETGRASLKGAPRHMGFASVCARFFDIEEEEAHSLFGARQNNERGLIARRDVIERIREFVKERT